MNSLSRAGLGRRTRGDGERRLGGTRGREEDRRRRRSLGDRRERDLERERSGPEEELDRPREALLPEERRGISQLSIGREESKEVRDEKTSKKEIGVRKYFQKIFESTPRLKVEKRKSDDRWGQGLEVTRGDDEEVMGRRRKRGLTFSHWLSPLPL